MPRVFCVAVRRRDGAASPAPPPGVATGAGGGGGGRRAKRVPRAGLHQQRGRAAGVDAKRTGQSSPISSIIINYLRYLFRQVTLPEGGRISAKRGDAVFPIGWLSSVTYRFRDEAVFSQNGEKVLLLNVVKFIIDN